MNFSSITCLHRLPTLRCTCLALPLSNVSLCSIPLCPCHINFTCLPSSVQQPPLPLPLPLPPPRQRQPQLKQILLVCIQPTTLSPISTMPTLHRPLQPSVKVPTKRCT